MKLPFIWRRRHEEIIQRLWTDVHRLEDDLDFANERIKHLQEKLKGAEKNDGRDPVTGRFTGASKA